MKVDFERFGYNNLLQERFYIYIYIYTVMNLSFKHISFSPISTNIHHYFNNTFREFKVLKKVIIAETFNVDFHNKFIKFSLFCFFYFSLYIYIYIYVYIYVRKFFFCCCWFKERKSNYFKMNRSTKSCVFLKELFILFLNTCMLPACCFHQRTYVVQGHMNGIPYETQTHSYRLVSQFFFRFCIGKPETFN